MPALTAYINPSGGKRHAFRDCPHLRPGYLTMTVDLRFVDCATCKRRLARTGQTAKEERSDVR